MLLHCKRYESQNSEADLGDIVLIHGTGAKGEMWSPQIKTLTERGYNCFVPDLRGHGSTAEPGEKSDLRVHMSDLLETLAQEDLRYPAVFAGHSLGSIISVELAAERPEMFKKIMAVSLPGRVPLLTVSAFEFLLGWPYELVKQRNLHHNFAWRERVLFETSHHSLSQVLENFRDLDYVSNLPSLSCPVHFAVGRLDPVAPWHHVKLMHEKLQNSTLTVIDWAGHNCMDSQPSKFNDWFFKYL